MRSFFTSTLFVVVLICLLLLGGGYLGWLMKDLSDATKTGLTYGFITFAILPISLCLWGVKEFNAAFPNVALELDKNGRNRLGCLIDDKIETIIVLAFFIVFIQIILAFCLLYFFAGSNYEFVILGILFGGILSSLVYGLYVCFSVRKLARTVDEIISKRVARERLEKYKKEFEDS